MQTEPLTDGFGLRITGVDVTALSDDQRDCIVEASNREGVLHLPGQTLTDAEQLAFTGLFGEVRTLRANRHRASKRPPGIVEISNVDADGNLMEPDAKTLQFSKGNRLWHSDYSYTQERAAQSLLYAEEAVNEGGETEFADMQGAYDALPEREKQRLEGLVGVHDRFHSRLRSGYTDFTEEERAAAGSAKHPLISVHPVTGRRSILIGSHVSAIIGMDDGAAEALLSGLLQHATQPQFVYRHTWAPGDLIIWDNRSTLHRGRPADPGQRRVMRRTAVHDPAVTNASTP